MAQRDSGVIQESLELWELLEKMEYLAHLEREDLLEKMAHQVQLDNPELLVH